MLSKILYKLFLILYSAGIRIASVWNGKAAKWVNGRKNTLSNINGQQLFADSQPIWMHCASLGEFEQGRPLLEKLKLHNPDKKIVLSFFSPSGYEVMKDYAGADLICYLPMDSPGNAKKFLDSVNPSLVLWVKYEYWFYYLDELKRRKIPILLVSGIFRPGQPFFKWYGNIWRKMLDSFTHFFVQNVESKELLESLGFKNNISLNGDTRFDRVIEIADKFIPVPFIDEFCGDNKVIVAGSTWEEDEIELLHFVNTNPVIKFIIAPHEINQQNLSDVKDEFPKSAFYSTFSAEGVAKKIGQSGKQPTPNVLIIDNVGMLSRLYKYATIAYVGGGFGGDGVHNVLEAAVYGKPVVFGPVYEKFDEAVGLVDAGGAISIDGPVSLEAAINNLLKDEKEMSERGEAAKKYVEEHAGASKKIIQFIQEKRLLTN